MNTAELEKTIKKILDEICFALPNSTEGRDYVLMAVRNWCSYRLAYRINEDGEQTEHIAAVLNNERM